MGAQRLLENIQLKRESQVSLKYLFRAFGHYSPQTWTSDDGFPHRGYVGENRTPGDVHPGGMMEGMTAWGMEGYNDKTSCSHKRS